MMLKKMLLFSIVMLLMVSLINAVESDVYVTFAVTDASVIYDLPFSLEVKANSQGKEFAAYDFTVYSLGGNIDFSGAQATISQSNIFEAEKTFTGVKDVGKAYRLRVQAKGSASFKSSAPQTIFTLKDLKFRGKDKRPDKVFLTLVTDESKGLGAPTMDASLNEPGNLVLVVRPTESALITPQFSTCGDAFVGYIDPEPRTGFETAAHEYCDTALSGGALGCKGDCRYIDLNYKITDEQKLADKKFCDYKSRTCALSPLTPQEKLLAKVSALVYADCFPYRDHPDALYCNAGVPQLQYNAQNKFEISTKVSLVSKIGLALTDFFREAVVQPRG